MRPLLRATAAFVLAGLVVPVTAWGGSLEIAHAWLNEPPPGQTGAALYMELRNGGAEPLAVVGARVEGAASAAIHGHRNEGGLMRMHAVPRLDIAPGADVRLQPGGYHLMVGGLARTPAAGENLPFCLRLEDGSERCAEARVRALGER